MSKFLWTVSSYGEPLPTIYIIAQKVNIYTIIEIRKADNQPLIKIAYLLLQLFLVSSRIYKNNFCIFAQHLTRHPPQQNDHE